MKKKLTILLGTTLLLAACNSNDVVEVSSSTQQVVTTSSKTQTEKSASTVVVNTNAANAVQVNMSEGSKTITQSGTYEITGTLSEGSLTVNVDKTVDDQDVILIFSNVSITSAKEAPVNIVEAKNVYIVLEDGSTNTINQGNISTSDTEFPSAAIHSKADLFITGSGSLKVTTAYNDGISSKDSLVIDSGNIQVTAAQDGLVGKDDLTINGGNIQVSAGKDGLKATNTEAGLGVIVINDGTINIAKAIEGIEAYGITINGGSTNVKSSDDGLNVKTGGVFEMNAGNLYVEASGDSIDANGSIVVNGGKITVNTSTVGRIDTPIDADYGITINGGSVVDQNGNAVNTQQMGPGAPGGFTIPRG